MLTTLSESNIFNKLENPEKPQVTFQDSVLVHELVRMGLYPYPRCWIKGMEQITSPSRPTGSRARVCTCTNIPSDS